MGANDYAIVVGIRRYPDLGDLAGPVDDAVDFHNWLLHPRGGNVPKDQAKLIVTTEPAAPGRPRPKRDDIDDALDDLYDIGKKKGKVGDRLYFYFAGHGFSTSLQDAALLMANAARGKSGYNISGRPYADWFRTAGFFKEVVLFMDCCRESYTVSTTAPPYEGIPGAKAGDRYYAFATEWSRASREGPWGPEGKMRGIFTLTLLAALRGAIAPDANGQISGHELAGYVINTIKKDQRLLALLLPGEEPYKPDFDFPPDSEVKFNAPRGEAASNPELEQQEKAGGLEAFTPAPPARYLVRLALTNGDSTRQFTLSSNDGVVPAASHSAKEWTWRVDVAGLYKVTRNDDGASTIFEVLGEKETIDVQLH